MKTAVRALVLGMLITGFAADHMLASKTVPPVRMQPWLPAIQPVLCPLASLVENAASTSSRAQSNPFWTGMQL